MMTVERISIELTNRCAKACWFCYNQSAPGGGTKWSVGEVVDFVSDCAANGVKAVSFGGGEPLQYEGLMQVLARLRGELFRSITTNGLMLDEERLSALAQARPEKVHMSVHFPQNEAEVERVIRQVGQIEQLGIRSGINLLVSRSNLAAARGAAERIRAAGIGNERIVYLPMRGQETPTPGEVAAVAGGKPFQSMSCLGGCAKSERFCSIGWDRRVAWCSYTTERRELGALTYQGLLGALDGLGLVFCGGG